MFLVQTCAEHRTASITSKTHAFLLRIYS